MKPMLIISVLIVNVCAGQSQWKITKVIATKQQTVIVEAKKMGTDSLALFPVTFKGIGKRKPLVGLWLTYHPVPYGRRKLRVSINQ
jgi:hypothetical protein